MTSIIEPFRIKMTEPLSLLTAKERIQCLKDAKQNVFLLNASDCTIDLLTDSGTGALSTKQWAAMMLGDESYAGSRSWTRFEQTVRHITGMKHVFPTHQGRAAENILAKIRIRKGDIVPNNAHFDTTRANFEFAGATALNLLSDEGYQLDADVAFKGNLDLEQLKNLIANQRRARIPFAMSTITNNAGGGQPVSMQNIRETKAILTAAGIPFIIDACRFAENAFFIKKNEAGYADKPLLEIAQEIFSYADGATMSLKKDGLSNIGGFFVCQDDQLAEDFKNMLIMQEGFPTYGGLSGRDLEVAAVGLMEALDYPYQEYRHATVQYVHKRLSQREIPLVRPAGGHAVFIDAGSFMSHIPAHQFPGVAVVNALYEVGGIRAVELGSLMFGRSGDREIAAPNELVRLAFPRRVYTQSHFDYLIESIEACWMNKTNYGGYKIVKQPQFLRHFSCWLERI